MKDMSIKEREEYYMEHGLKEENYVAKFHPHCEDHCSVLAEPKGMPIIRKEQPCTNHKLDSWDDCWECYLESK